MSVHRLGLKCTMKVHHFGVFRIVSKFMCLYLRRRYVGVSSECAKTAPCRLEWGIGMAFAQLEAFCSKTCLYWALIETTGLLKELNT